MSQQTGSYTHTHTGEAFAAGTFLKVCESFLLRVKKL